MSIRFQTLLHKAQAALNRGTIESTNAALGILAETSRLDLSDGEQALVDSRTAEAEKALAGLEAAQTEAESQADEKEAVEAEGQEPEEAATPPAS